MKGALPPGIKLEDEGLLHGEAERAGEFEFTVSATDSRGKRSSGAEGICDSSALGVDSELEGSGASQREPD